MRSTTPTVSWWHLVLLALAILSLAASLLAPWATVYFSGYGSNADDLDITLANVDAKGEIYVLSAGLLLIVTAVVVLAQRWIRHLGVTALVLGIVVVVDLLLAFRELAQFERGLVEEMARLGRATEGTVLGQFPGHVLVSSVGPQLGVLAHAFDDGGRGRIHLATRWSADRSSGDKPRPRALAGAALGNSVGFRA